MGKASAPSGLYLQATTLATRVVGLISVAALCLAFKGSAGAATGPWKAAKTDTAGSYSVDWPAGTGDYAVTVTAAGFQTASVIRMAIQQIGCDAVSIARPLMANPNLPHLFAEGKDHAERPCTFCNKCMLNVLEHPLGCYDETRYGGNYERMMDELMSFYKETDSAR